MRSERLKFKGDWPACTSFGEPLQAQSYERDDGMRYVRLADPRRTPSLSALLHRDTTRLVYRDFDGQVILLGLNVAPHHRRQGGSADLIRYFMRTIDAHGGTFLGTGHIHKPLIALCLSRLGLEPESTDFQAEILPRSVYDTSAIPKVHVVKDAIEPDKVVTHSDTGAFYTVVAPELVAATYPIGSPDHVVALHTPYVPPQPVV